MLDQSDGDYGSLSAGRIIYIYPTYTTRTASKNGAEYRGGTRGVNTRVRWLNNIERSVIDFSEDVTNTINLNGQC